MSEAIGIIIVVVLLGVVASEIKNINNEQKNELATCTTKNLDNSSFIVCTYKNKVFFSGEIKNE